MGGIVVLLFFIVFFVNASKATEVAKKQNAKPSNDSIGQQNQYSKAIEEFEEQHKANNQGLSPAIRTAGSKSSGKTNLNGKTMKVKSFERKKDNIVEDSQDRAYHGKLSRESRDDEKEWFK